MLFMIGMGISIRTFICCLPGSLLSSTRDCLPHSVAIQDFCFCSIGGNAITNKV